MHGHAANEVNIADTSNRTSEYMLRMRSISLIPQTVLPSTLHARLMDIIVRVMIRITDFDGRAYHRVDYRVQSLVRMSASTTANNSASNCADDTNIGSGDRSPSPPMCAGVCVVVQYEPCPSMLL
jgi:hypothetical protein